MNTNSNSRTESTRKSSSLLAAVLIGMLLGLTLAGGVAWYILKRPNPFMNYAPHEAVKLTPDPVKPVQTPLVKVAPEAISAVTAASGVASSVGESKPRFEFYKVLTDKPDGVVTAQPATKHSDKAAAKETYFLQAGAFANADDADKLKARLAMMGMEASVQAATLPDKSVWHRVRLGPYKSTEELNKVSAELKQNGVSATPMRAQ